MSLDQQTFRAVPCGCLPFFRDPDFVWFSAKAKRKPPSWSVFQEKTSRPSAATGSQHHFTLQLSSNPPSSTPQRSVSPSRSCSTWRPKICQGPPKNGRRKTRCPLALPFLQLAWHLWGGTWKISFLLKGRPLSCHVSGREGNPATWKPALPSCERECPIRVTAINEGENPRGCAGVHQMIRPTARGVWNTRDMEFIPEAT